MTQLNFPDLYSCTVAIIGLGYVGLPLAVEFSKRRPCFLTGRQLNRRVLGFDINTDRLEELRNGHDRTNEISPHELSLATSLEFTSNHLDLSSADVFIVTVPTPIDTAKRPNLRPLEMASSTVGRALKSRNSESSPLIIYESTVYPGATEEVCVPILEQESGLTFNYSEDGKPFYCGYSPERINPGDHEHKLTSIVKVTSGSTLDSSDWIDSFYGSIIEAGTHKAASIKVAEAAKVIENTQRDLNIALVNELAIIFKQMEIDTLDVLKAAGTKWNFLPFKPGLVGGHCIGVDPYYLTHKAEQLGYHPQIVLAGRRINDGMGRWIAEQIVLELAKKNQPVVGSKVLVLGLTFKENCPDLRNTKVVDLISGLKLFGMHVDIVDNWANPAEAQREYGLKLFRSIPSDSSYVAIVAAVAHDSFVNMSIEEWLFFQNSNSLIFDLKGIIPRSINPVRI